MIRILVNGYKGRMGQTIINSAKEFNEIELAAKTDIGDKIEDYIQQCDVVVDFSYHEATVPLTRLCSQYLKPIVIGTTGHTEEEKINIRSFSEKIPIVLSSNYSTGVNTLFYLVRKAAETLGLNYDNEIIEVHHRMKKDAPSGTALTLAEILAEVRKKELSEIARYGRNGIVGERTSDEIGIHSVRAGDVVGDHTVIFATNGERIEITHKASTREAFAKGALRAAIWIYGKNPGMYNMMDVLGLK